jgi:hypothetical protein
LLVSPLHGIYWLMILTGWERLLELIGLLRILQHQGVEVSLASDLELDLLGLWASLYARS